jgi:outer membrane protein assembly factor BamB
VFLQILIEQTLWIRAYSPDGEVLWSSAALSTQAHYSAPIIGPDGGVIAADQNRIIRFDPSGTEVWSMPTAGGSPISPNVTDNGEIVLATQGGPVSAYDFATGNLIAQLRLDATIAVSGRMRTGFFDTINTPAIRGNRIYISTRFRYGYRTTNIGRLYALDLVPPNFAIAWFYEFRAPSGTSPTLGSDGERTIIYFDGSGLTPSSGNDPRALAVRDMGREGVLLWSYQMSNLPQSSPALDPRESGGIWYFAFASSELLRLDEISGGLIQTIDVDSIVGDDTGTFIPHSVMTISGDGESPVMMVAAAASNYSRAYVIAIDLNAGSLLWKYQVDEGRGFNGTPAGQYPMLLNSEEEPVVVFSTRQNGVWGLVIEKPDVEPEL